MSTALSIYESPAGTLAVADVKAHIQLIQQVMRETMKNGVHYGTIPGCGNKPTLLKAGSDLLAATFRLSAEPIITDLSTSDECRYRVEARICHATTGQFLGSGIGEASSNEDKYRFRRSVCQEEFDATPETHRRLKWSRGQGGKAYSTQQVRTHPADVANTVLKMAEKRAVADAVLRITAASDVFSQDLDTVSPEVAQAITENDAPPPIQQPQAKPSSGDGPRLISEAQGKRLFALLKESGKTPDQLKAYLAEFGLEHTRDIPMSAYETVCNWVQAK